MIVVWLGSVLSLIPRLKQKNKPDSDLLVPVMKVSTNWHKYLRYFSFKSYHMIPDCNQFTFNLIFIGCSML